MTEGFFQGRALNQVLKEMMAVKGRRIQEKKEFLYSDQF